jgi:hypothetical protein
MPATLHAISFLPTGNVLAVCTLEKQNLADAAAWAQLRDALVGDALSISLLQSPPAPSKMVPDPKFSIPKEFLAVDPIPTILPSDDVVGNPYTHQVSLLSPTAVAVPGDGTDKILKGTGADNIDLAALPRPIDPDVAANTITITFTTVPTVAWLVLEGQLPVKGNINTTTKKVTFSFGSAVSLATNTQFLLFTDSAEVKVRLLP